MLLGGLGKSPPFIAIHSGVKDGQTSSPSIRRAFFLVFWPF
jgi:hypothetical protein